VAFSSSTRLRSRPVSARSRRSRIAWAWISDRLNRSISAARASTNARAGWREANGAQRPVLPGPGEWGCLGLGTAAGVVLDETASMVDFLHNSCRFFAQESCGQCTPCREGTSWSERILYRIKQGKGRLKDLDLLATIGDSIGIMPGTTICGLADGAAWPIKNALKKFRGEFEDYIKRTNPTGYANTQPVEALEVGLTRLGGAGGAGLSTALPGLERARTQMQTARQELERVAALPQAERAAIDKRSTRQVIDQMFEVVELKRRVGGRSRELRIRDAPRALREGLAPLLQVAARRHRSNLGAARNTLLSPPVPGGPRF